MDARAARLGRKTLAARREAPTVQTTAARIRPMTSVLAAD
jgi:hypothetical protein